MVVLLIPVAVVGYNLWKKHRKDAAEKTLAEHNDCVEATESTSDESAVVFLESPQLGNSSQDSVLLYPRSNEVIVQQLLNDLIAPLTPVRESETTKQGEKLAVRLHLSESERQALICQVESDSVLSDPRSSEVIVQELLNDLTAPLTPERESETTKQGEKLAVRLHVAPLGESATSFDLPSW